jgi:hypothetical protein
MPNRRYNPGQYVRKEVRGLGKSLLRNVKNADKEYTHRYNQEHGQQGTLFLLFLLLLRLLVAVCVACIFLWSSHLLAGSRLLCQLSSGWHPGRFCGQSLSRLASSCCGFTCYSA